MSRLCAQRMGIPECRTLQVSTLTCTISEVPLRHPILGNSPSNTTTTIYHDIVRLRGEFTNLFSASDFEAQRRAELHLIQKVQNTQLVWISSSIKQPKDATGIAHDTERRGPLVTCDTRAEALREGLAALPAKNAI